MKKILDGSEMYSWAQDLFPICRSITGAGVRETLSYIKKLLPDLDIHEIKSGEKVMDWKVPQEWDIKDAYVKNEKGEKIIDFRKNNLHLVSYSEPIDTTMSLKDLQKNLHSIPAQPDAIPYITSYYSRNWGFCISQQQRDSLMDENYQVFIDSELKNGVMNYADLVIKGKSSKEILLSTYICHPSMGNNELSGPIVSTALAKWISSLNDPYYTYRFIFIPETIGSIAYLSKHMEHLKVNVIAGFNITCVGDDRCYSFMPSRNGSTLADRVGKHVLSNIDSDYQQYTWLDRGSDERQYCAPGVDLPIATIMRSKYGEYPEYHTSLDDLSLISPAGLRGGLNAFIRAIEAIEFNFYPKVNVLGEPQLGKRGLYPETSTLESTDAVRTLMDFITYADGTIDLLEIAEKINIPIWELYEIVEILVDHGLISALEEQK